jgi:pyridoxal phosphate enzyme (YggS family)
MSISENIKSVKSSLPENVKLLAVSKFKSETEILEAYRTGQRIFAENKVQEMLSKYENLPKDIEWHFIGHLQTNKVKFIAPFVSMIHAVDSLKLLEKINAEARKNNRIIPCLFEIHIASEESKFGFSPDEIIDLCKSTNFKTFSNIQISGLMGMATFTDNTAQIRQEFRNLKDLFHIMKKEIFHENCDFKELSMGMSDDYGIAVEEGSTMVRIGSLIFGNR